MDRDTDALLERRVVVIDGVIDERIATEVIAKMLYLADGSSREILLLIDSPGGTFVAGAAITDTMADLNVSVATHAETADGIAALVLTHGSAGRRSLSPSSSLQITPLSSASAPADELRRLTEIARQRLVTRTRLTQDQLDDAFQLGLRLTPALALETGCIDTVSSTEDILRCCAAESTD